jgi:hypothetical protein
MPTSVSITTTYAGQFSGKYIAAALLSAPTLDKEYITIKPNIKYKEVVKTLSQTNIIVDATCDFTSTGSVSLNERILQPDEFQVNTQLCKKDFRSDWDAISMGYSAYDVLPKSFQDFLISRMLGQVAEATERSIWKGVNATSGQFGGIFTQAIAEAGTGIPSGQVVSGTSVTASNVIAEMGKVVDAIPSRLYSNPNLKLYVSQNVARAYVRALGGFAAAGVGAAGTNAQGTQWYGAGSGLSFDGVPVFVANGLSNNEMFATLTDNIFFGTGILSDFNEVKLIDMAMIDGSQNVRFVMRYTAGTQIAILEDCVVYFD